MKDIDGWGSDLKMEKRPGVPMWKRPDEGTGAHWKSPPMQTMTIKEFHSVDKPGMTPVFGTSVPPKGLSGLIRKYAFSYSEGSWGHWLPLIFADRVNMIEGIFSDLIHGHIPNVYKEMGGPAEWKYNKRGFQKKVLFVSMILLAIPAFLSLRKNSES
jgi:hypothetical protein